MTSPKPSLSLVAAPSAHPLRGRRFPRSFILLIDGRRQRGMHYTDNTRALAAGVRIAQTTRRKNWRSIQIVGAKSGRVIWEIVFSPTDRGFHILHG